MEDPAGVSTVDADRLAACVRAAVARRADLITQWAAEDTDCYRLFHGVAEGWPGLTIDRYGALVLAQEFRGALEPPEREAVAQALGPVTAGAELVWRGRYAGAPRAADSAPIECRELGARYAVAAWHRGQDPWLFLDFRAVRRWLRAHAQGKSVLNLFAYTCTAGVAAALGGAREVWNVDFAASSLAIGRANAQRNGVLAGRFLAEDCLPVLRQLAGQPVQRQGSRRRFAAVAPRTFDLVVLDPPPLAKSPFGTVDAARDYEGLFKPAWLALAPGGVLLAANNLASVAWDDFAQRLRRCAEKAGTPIASLTRLLPEADFPTFDAQPPLKIALCSK
jgi:23S rRNA (cytosine1962-C5)-methyltransferase